MFVYSVERLLTTALLAEPDIAGADLLLLARTTWPTSFLIDLVETNSIRQLRA